MWNVYSQVRDFPAPWGGPCCALEGLIEFSNPTYFDISNLVILSSLSFSLLGLSIFFDSWQKNSFYYVHAYTINGDGDRMSC